MLHLINNAHHKLNTQAYMTLPNRELILPLWINLTLLEKAFALQPLPIRLVPLLPAIVLLHIQRILPYIQELFKFLNIFFCRVEFARRCVRLRCSVDRVRLVEVRMQRVLLRVGVRGSVGKRRADGL